MKNLFNPNLSPMNRNWKNFLISQQANIENDNRVGFTSPSPESRQRIYPVPHLTVLKVAGNDAAKLLQGQMTCNVNEATVTQSSIGAFCNPKGRAIATFLLIKTPDAFLLVLPVELLQTITTRLQKYVLRSDVSFTDCSDEYCLIGVSQADAQSGKLFATRQQDIISVSLSSSVNRCLVIAETAQAIDFWTERVKRQGFQPGDSEQWRCLDLLAGIPWLGAVTSEEFIPQMLNLDKLGGISFNKGCYTGQEIVARTHYLGKAKRALFVAECELAAAPEPNSLIFDDTADSAQSAGTIVDAVCLQNHCTLLIVLQLSDNDRYDLSLKDHPGVLLRLLTFAP